MGFVSVRNLTILLTLVCIAVTAAVCTAIAVTSADRALDTTKDASNQQLIATRHSGQSALTNTRRVYDDGLAQAFSSAESSITDRTRELLTALATGAGASVFNLLQKYQAAAEAHTMAASATKPIQDTQKLSWMQSKAVQMWAEHKNTANTGVSGMGLYSFDGVAVHMFESSLTYSNPTDGLHHMLKMECPEDGRCLVGTVLPGGVLNFTANPEYDRKLPSGGYEDSLCYWGRISRVTGKECDMYAKPGCRMNSWPLTNGVIDDGACPTPYVVTAQTNTQLYKALWPSDSRTRFTHLISTAVYLGFGIAGKWHDERGVPMGYFQLPVEVGPVSAYLASVEVAGPGAISRLFVTIKESWLEKALPLPMFQQNGVIVGASHGNASSFNHEFVPALGRMGFTKSPIMANEATDPIIRATARWAEGSFEAGLVDTVGKVQAVAKN
eukprot:Hpha_TRINITY_DN16408_c4_g4::TRINITY_DN16408_c4_g4_i1::g.159402::m.159402